MCFDKNYQYQSSKSLGMRTNSIRMYAKINNASANSIETKMIFFESDLRLDGPWLFAKGKLKISVE